MEEQDVLVTPATAADTAKMLTCQARGKEAGKRASTGGSLVGGFAGGVLLGLIGTGIAMAVQGAPEPPANELYQVGQEDCRLFYTEAYKKKLRGRKRTSALLGGLLGTAVAVVIIVSLQDTE